MSEPKRPADLVGDRFSANIKGFDRLVELALDLRWSWNHAADDIWRQLCPTLWEYTHNPWGILQTMSREEIEREWADPAFRAKVSTRSCSPRKSRRNRRGGFRKRTRTHR